jgi:pimeloyl-ACP methyl ester carboxylesterase
LQGAQDQYATRQHLAEIEARVGGEASSRLIPDCGHAPHHEAAETTLRLMTDFLVGSSALTSPRHSADVEGKAT